MKVLFIQNIEGIAGSEKYFIQLIPELKKKGLEVEFLSVYLESKETEYKEFQGLLEEAGIKSSALTTKKYYSPKVLIKLKRFFKKNQYDVIHSHLIYADFWIASLRKIGFLKNVKTISTLHGYQERIYVEYCLNPEKLPKNLYYRIAKFSYKYIDKVYACSHGLKDFYDKSSIHFKNGIDVIQHGFNYPEIEHEREHNDKMILSIIGRVIPRKGHTKVLEGFEEIINQHPNVLLRIVGDGSSLEELKNYVESKNLSKHVEFTGFQTDVHYYYENSDIVLVPSFAEGLPLVIFEAFNHAKPVVAFETIGPEEAIEHGETGYLAKPFDAKEFQTLILKLMESKDLREKMGKKAEGKLKSHFNLERMTTDTLNYYVSAIG